MKRLYTLCMLVALGTALAAANVQRSAPAAGAAVVGLQKLKENLYLLTGGGGNSLAFVTDLGVVLVDTKQQGWGQPMLDKLKTVTNKPVTTIVNTHSHADQTSGNRFFPTSVEIIAHENTRFNMDKLDAFKGANVNYLPKLMFREKMTIGSGKDRVDLLYFGPGHTGGDAWVVFPTARVAHVGDLVLARQPPIVDFESGGSGLAYPDTLAKAAASLKNVDTLVPAEGALLTMADLQEYARFTRDFRSAAVSGFHHGLGVGEVAAAWKLPEPYQRYTADPERVRANVRVIFSELTR